MCKNKILILKNDIKTKKVKKKCKIETMYSLIIKLVFVLEKLYNETMKEHKILYYSSNDNNE